jgi:hypothetical protein
MTTINNSENSCFPKEKIFCDEVCPVCLMSELNCSNSFVINGCGHTICNSCEPQIRKKFSIMDKDNIMKVIKCPICRSPEIPTTEMLKDKIKELQNKNREPQRCHPNDMSRISRDYNFRDDDANSNISSPLRSSVLHNLDRIDVITQDIMRNLSIVTNLADLVDRLQVIQNIAIHTRDRIAPPRRIPAYILNRDTFHDLPPNNVTTRRRGTRRQNLVNEIQEPQPVFVPIEEEEEEIVILQNEQPTPTVEIQEAEPEPISVSPLTIPEPEPETVVETEQIDAVEYVVEEHRTVAPIITVLPLTAEEIQVQQRSILRTRMRQLRRRNVPFTRLLFIPPTSEQLRQCNNIEYCGRQYNTRRLCRMGCGRHCCGSCMVCIACIPV